MILRRPESLAVLFTGPGQVELRRERLARPRRGQLLLEGRRSLVSTGTERTCLQRDFAPGGHWDEWVTYPFHPGYSYVGASRGGERFCAHVPHAQRALLDAGAAIPVPDGVEDEEACWFALASIAQLGIAAAAIAPGDLRPQLPQPVLGRARPLRHRRRQLHLQRPPQPDPDDHGAERPRRLASRRPPRRRGAGARLRSVRADPCERRRRSRH